MPPVPAPPTVPPRVAAPPPGTKDHRIGEAYNYNPPRRSAFELHEEGKPPIGIEIEGQLDEDDVIVDSHTVEVDGKWRKDGALHTRRVVDRDDGRIIIGKRQPGQIIFAVVFLMVFLGVVAFIVYEAVTNSF